MMLQAVGKLEVQEALPGVVERSWWLIDSFPCCCAGLQRHIDLRRRLQRGEWGQGYRQR
jgi:hypothetical protein